MAIALILFVVALIGLSMGVLANETGPQDLTAMQGGFRFDFTEGDGSGVVASCANPLGQDAYIRRALLVITTPSTGASTLDIGVAAAIGTSNDTLFDGKSGATAGVFDNLKAADAGTNGLAGLFWDADNFLTIAEASGDVTGIEGYLLLDLAAVPSA